MILLAGNKWSVLPIIIETIFSTDFTQTPFEFQDSKGVFISSCRLLLELSVFKLNIDK